MTHRISSGPHPRSNLPVFPLFFLKNSSQTTEKCSAEVLFPRGEQKSPAQVQASCDELLKLNITAQEEALYKQYKNNENLVSAQYLPGTYDPT